METRYRSEKQRQGGQNQITKIIQTGYLICFFFFCCKRRKERIYVGGSLAVSGTLFVFLNDWRLLGFSGYTGECWVLMFSELLLLLCLSNKIEENLMDKRQRAHLQQHSTNLGVRDL